MEDLNTDQLIQIDELNGNLWNGSNRKIAGMIISNL